MKAEDVDETESADEVEDEEGEDKCGEDGATLAAGFLFELFFETDKLLKHRESSAAALLVKLTSADMTESVPPNVLFQAALKMTKKQATKKKM